MLNLFQHIFLWLCFSTAIGQNPINNTKPTSTTSTSDDKKEIEIINSDFLIYNNQGFEVQILMGHVKIKHEGTYVEYDSAVVIKAVKKIDAYGHVYINHNGNIDIYSDVGYYFGANKTADLKGHVILNDGKIKLEAPEVHYDMNSSIGNYTNSGTVYNGETVINSKKGTYYNQSSDVFFRDNVVVNNPKFTLTSDTLKYNSKTELATFYSYTTIKGDGSIYRMLYRAL